MYAWLELVLFRWRLVGCLDEDYLVILKYAFLFILMIYLLYGLKIFYCPTYDSLYAHCNLWGFQ